MKLSEAVSRFTLSRQAQRVGATLVIYAHTLDSLLLSLSDVPIEEIKTDDLHRWQIELSWAGRSIYTLHRTVRLARAFFNWCVDEGYLGHSPAAQLSLPRLPRRGK